MKQMGSSFKRLDSSALERANAFMAQHVSLLCGLCSDPGLLYLLAWNMNATTIQNLATKISRPLSTIILIFIWWAANSYYAVDAQLLLSHFDENWIFIELAVVQLLLGVVLSSLYVSCVTSNKHEEGSGSQDAISSFSVASSHGRILVLVGFFNFIGTVLTNASYQIIGSTATMVWKLSEPISVVALKYMFLGERTSITSILGIIHIIAGVVLFSWHKVTGISASPIVIANLAYPARNVAFKVFQKKRPLSSTSRFLHMQASSMPFAFSLFVAKLLFQPSISNAFPHLIWNAVLFNMYQFASIALLEKFDALTHAIGNTCKRFFGILLSAMLIREVFIEQQTCGLVFAIIGFILYIAGGDKLGKELASKVRLAKSLCIVLSIMLVLRVITAQQRTRGPLGPLFVLVSGYRKAPKPHMPESYREASQMLRSHDSDLNKVSLRGMTRIENVMNKRHIVVCSDAFINCYGEMQNFSDTLVIQSGGNFPLTNSIDIGDTQHINILASQSHLFSKIALMRVGLVPTGIHWDNRLAQHIFDGELQGLSSSAVVIPISVIHSIKVLQDRNAAFLVNGEISMEILRLNGISSGVLPVGEISFFLRNSPMLGRRWEERYKLLGGSAGNGNLKIQVHLDLENSKKTFQLRTHLYQELLTRYRNVVFFVDKPEDLNALQQSEIPFENIRVKGGPSSLCEMDVSIGSDVSDAVEAFICKQPVPVILIPRNFQTLEVAQAMKIPYMLWDDGELWGLPSKMKAIVRLHKLDGSAFDRNRCLRSKEMLEVFEDFRGYFGSAVQRLALSC